MARPSEIKVVAALLMDPADDINELAKAIIGAVDESRTERVDYMVCRRYAGIVDAYGPFATRKAAEKAIETGKVRGYDGTRFYVIPVRHPSQAEADIEKADAQSMSEGAHRCWQIARNGGQKAAIRNKTRGNRRR